MDPTPLSAFGLTNPSQIALYCAHKPRSVLLAAGQTGTPSNRPTGHTRCLSRARCALQTVFSKHLTSIRLTQVPLIRRFTLGSRGPTDAWETGALWSQRDDRARDSLTRSPFGLPELTQAALKQPPTPEVVRRDGITRKRLELVSPANCLLVESDVSAERRAPAW